MSGLRKQLHDAYVALDEAPTYAAWRAVAVEIDAMTGADAWRAEDASDHYDAEALRSSMLAMRRLRAEGDARGLASLLTEDLYRHLNDLLAPQLYDVALAGPKKLVEEYLVEAERCLYWLIDAPGVPREAKLAQFDKAWHVFGRTALLLSGGATWGFHHLGVVKALFELGLLPDILSGASIGAMMAAGVCVRSDDELADLFADPLAHLRLDGLRPVGVGAALEQRALFDLDRLSDVLHHNIGDVTFAEAHARSGRILAISVSPTRYRQKARLLSHLTAPDVLVTSAVLASSALPGLFPPVELARRGPSGVILPYVTGEKWVDGSIAGDLPKRRLSRLHNANHFVVSQTNPHVAPFLGSVNRRSVGARVVRAATATARTHGAWATELLRVVLGSSQRVGRLAAAANSMIRQDYRGHVDVHPSFRWGLVPKTVSNPTPDDLLDFVIHGERSVFPRVALIREQTRIGRAFKRAMTQLSGGPAPSARPPSGPSRRGASPAGRTGSAPGRRG